MSNEAGEIRLNLELDRTGFNRSLNGVQSLANKASKALAGAFAVKKLVDFTKSALDLGSALSEVQNVVDVTFPSMSAKVDEFAKSAAGTYGLSETMAKKYAGTFGSMAESFGFTEKAALEMGTTLTGLAGDVASFYNMSQDEAYTKLKSVFTGETESLKELGVVMTQTALDQYAMSNGFGKTTAAMTEAEKVALRYSFVQSQLTNAAGDFARTSGSWANQVRLLTLQFDSFKASVGQGLIVVFTPVIKMLNYLMSKLVAVGNAFKGFMEKLTGRKFISSTITDTASSMGDVAANTENASTNLDKVNSKIKKLKREIAGFDKVTKLSDTSSDTVSSTPSISGGATSGGGMVDGMAPSEESTTKVTRFGKALERLKDAFKNLGNAIVSVAKPALTFIWEKIFKPMGKFAGKAFLGFLNIMAEGLNAIAGFVQKHPTLFQGLLTTILGLTAVSKVSKRINAFRATFLNLGGLAGMSKKLFGAFKLVFSPKSLIVLGIVAAVSAGIYLYKNWDKIKNKLLKIIDKLKKKLSKVKGFFKNVKNWVVKPFKDIGTKIKDAFAKIDFEDVFSFMLSAFKTMVFGLPGLLLSEIDWSNVASQLSETIGDIKAKVSAEFTDKKEDLKEKWNYLTDSIKDKIADMKANVATKVSDLRNYWKKRLDVIIDKTAKMKAKIATKKSSLKSKWNSLVSSIKNKTVTITAKLKDLITAKIKNMWNGIANGINKAIDKINAIPGVNIKKLPMLAQGGYVKKNTPQLAMIGDNRHQGEIVAPENKLMEMARMAAQGSGGASPEMIRLLQEIVNLIKDLDLTAYISGNDITNLVIKLINNKTKTTGRSPIII